MILLGERKNIRVKCQKMISFLMSINGILKLGKAELNY